MKNLLEISRIVTNNKISSNDILNEKYLLHKDTKINEFYKASIQGKFKNDREAAKGLYDTTPADGRYRKLKNIFKNKLLNTVLLLDLEKTEISKYYLTYCQCIKNQVIISILGAFGGRNPAIQIAKKTLGIAFQYKFADVILYCAKLLRNESGIKGDEAQYKRYNLLVKDTLKLMEAEDESEELNQLLIAKHIKSIAAQPELIEEAKKYANRLKYLAGRFDSFVLRFNMYRVCAYAHEIEMDYRDAIKVYNEAEQYLVSSPPFDLKVRFAEIALKKMHCYLHTRDYEKGRLNAEKCIQLYRTGSNNWLLFQEFYFLLAMHTGNFKKAADIFRTATGHNRFKYIADNQKEKWRIFEAYLNYIYHANGLDISLLEETRGQRFKLYRFLNEVPIFSKDKSGYNVSILIVQILLLLEKGEFGGIIDRAEALKVYRSRYLKKPEQYRSNNFVKMLLIMEQKGFRYEKTMQFAQSYLEKLKVRQMKYQGTVSSLEVIPYEQMWENVLSKLQEYEKVHVI